MELGNNPVAVLLELEKKGEISHGEAVRIYMKVCECIGRQRWGNPALGRQLKSRRKELGK